MCLSLSLPLGKDRPSHDCNFQSHLDHAAMFVMMLHFNNSSNLIQLFARFNQEVQLVDASCGCRSCCLLIIKPLPLLVWMGEDIDESIKCDSRRISWKLKPTDLASPGPTPREQEQSADCCSSQPGPGVWGAPPEIQIVGVTCISCSDLLFSTS
eukprot:g49504.t1